MEDFILIMAAVAAVVVLTIDYLLKVKRADRVPDKGELEFSDRIGLEFPNAAIHIHVPTQSLCVVDFDTSKIMLGLGRERGSFDQPYRSDFDFSQVASINVKKGETGLASTVRRSQVLGLVIGGLVFWGLSSLIMDDLLAGFSFAGLGSLIGGLSGAKRQCTLLNHLSIVITIRDQMRPMHDITFFSCGAGEEGVPTHSEVAKRALAHVETFAAHIENVIYSSNSKVA